MAKYKTIDELRLLYTEPGVLRGEVYPTGLWFPNTTAAPGIS